MQHSGLADDLIPRGQRSADELFEFETVGLDEKGPGGHCLRQRLALRVYHGLCALGAQGGAQLGVVAGRNARRTRAGEHSVAIAGEFEHFGADAVQCRGVDHRPGGADLELGTRLALLQGGVDTGFAVDAHQMRMVDLPGGQSLEQHADFARHGGASPCRNAQPLERARHVDTVAAGIKPRGGGVDFLVFDQLRDVVAYVHAGVEREGDDGRHVGLNGGHAVSSLRCPQP